MIRNYPQKDLERNKSAARASTSGCSAGDFAGGFADGKSSVDRFARAQMMPHNPQTDQKEKAPSLSDEAQKQIGRKLRLLYEQLEAEPIPDKFVDLLRALAEKESKPR
jgi:Anti-sigma factor NepR